MVEILNYAIPVCPLLIGTTAVVLFQFGRLIERSRCIKIATKWGESDVANDIGKDWS